MLTVCPKCTLTLAVTATDLRTGQGYVRCGRCATVFNALVALSEESGSDTGSTQPNPVLTLPEDSANDSALLPAIEPDKSSDQDLVESSGTGTVETIVLEGDGATQTEEFIDIETIDSEIAAATWRQFDAVDNTPEPEVVTLVQHAPAEETFFAEPAEFADAADADEQPAIVATDPPQADAARFPAPLLIGALTLLLVLLGVQVIHHWRNDLATSPGWYAALQKPYQMLGVKLTPNWDLKAYDLRQLGAAANADTDNAIRVRISLVNRAVHAQPFPVLRLSLFNRYGKMLAVHELEPREYLPGLTPGPGLMKVAQRIDTEVGVTDAGPEAASFELDVCVASVSGLRCANDEPLNSVSHS
jgi:predicted Zn finger-like uncharacterized protein